MSDNANKHLYTVNNITRDVSQGENVSKGNLGHNGFAFFGTDEEANFLQENGRMNGLNGLTGNKGYSIPEEERNTFSQEAIRGIHDGSQLTNVFFSEYNIKYLQDTVKYDIYKKTNKVIAPQDSNAMKLIMRSIYLQYSQNLDCKLKQQILRLNGKVLEVAVPEIETNLSQYLKYITDITTQPVFMGHPVNVSSKGEKTYALDSFI
jgi:hypothetical protein